MPRKPAPKDDPEQSKRFIEAAKKAGADDEQALDRAFKKIASAKKDAARAGSARNEN
jgi:hypothetical protein